LKQRDPYADDNIVLRWLHVVNDERSKPGYDGLKIKKGRRGDQGPGGWSGSLIEVSIAGQNECLKRKTKAYYLSTGDLKVAIRKRHQGGKDRAFTITRRLGRGASKEKEGEGTL